MNSEIIKIEMVKIDLKTGKKLLFEAELSREKTDKHHIYSLTYEGFRSDWQEVK